MIFTFVNIVFQFLKKHYKKLNKKIVVRCCDKQNITFKYNKPVCINCETICIIDI